MAFRSPFYLHMEGEAVRAFADMANDKNHPVGQHPEDYTLFCLGDWNDQSAKATSFDTPKSFGLAIEHIKQEELPMFPEEIPSLLKEQSS